VPGILDCVGEQVGIPQAEVFAHTKPQGADGDVGGTHVLRCRLDDGPEQGRGKVRGDAALGASGNRRDHLPAPRVMHVAKLYREEMRDRPAEVIPVRPGAAPRFAQGPSTAPRSSTVASACGASAT
jgi:hypothetical protein